MGQSHLGLRLGCPGCVSGSKPLVPVVPEASPALGLGLLDGAAGAEFLEGSDHGC